MFPHFLLSRRWGGLLEECQWKTQCPPQLYPRLSPGTFLVTLPQHYSKVKQHFEMLCFSFAPGRLKKFPLPSELRLQQTKSFREQLLPNFINTCINKSGKKLQSLPFVKKSLLFIPLLDQIPSQLIPRRYPETNEKLGKFPNNLSQISEWTAQENSHAVQEPLLLETRLFPQKQEALSHFSRQFWRKNCYQPAASPCASPTANSAVFPTLAWERAPSTAAFCATTGCCGGSSIHLCSCCFWAT